MIVRYSSDMLGSVRNVGRRVNSSRLMSTLSVDLGSEVFSTHNFEAPGTTVETDKEELMRFLREMYTMRRMEITNDTEYKVSGLENRFSLAWIGGTGRKKLLSIGDQVTSLTYSNLFPSNPFLPTLCRTILIERTAYLPFSIFTFK